MGQIANQMLIDAIIKLKEKLRNKNTKKRNVTQEKGQGRIEDTLLHRCEEFIKKRCFGVHRES